MFVGGSGSPDGNVIRQIQLNGKYVNAFLDSGSPCCFIDATLFQSLFPKLPVLEDSVCASFTSISGSQFSSLGKCRLVVSLNGDAVELLFNIVNTPMNVILGRDALCALNVKLNFATLKKVHSPTVASSRNEKQSKAEFLKLFDLTNNVSLPHFDQLTDLLFEYRDIFSIDSFDIGQANNCFHNIDVGDNKPIYCKPYRLPHSQMKVSETYIKEMLQAGVIEPSQSSWSSPHFLVDKADGSSRFVIDFRKLNSITVKDRMPLPNTEELLDKLSGSKVFSCLDLTSGFWQIPLSEASKEKTAFSINNCQYQFRVMPFGLCNAPATFQRLMINLTNGLPTTPYIDDIILPSLTVSDNINLLRTIFNRLRTTNFKLKPKKCKFFQNEIKYLGFVVKNNTVKPDPEKIKAIEQTKLPQNLKELQSFLGMCNFFGKFVPHYAEKSKSLSSLQNKDPRVFKVLWQENLSKLEEEFESLKTDICEITSLQLPDFEKQFTIMVDASDHSIGGALLQDNRPIAFYSRKLSPAERNYSTIDKEYLALFSCIKRFRPYLFGVHFIAYTDHKPLISFLNHAMKSSRQQRWFLQLQEYNFDLNYIKGSNNVVSDFLSRVSAVHTAHSDSLEDKIKKAQNHSEIIQNCIEHLHESKALKFTDDISQSIRKCESLSPSTFSVKNKLLWHDVNLVIPPEMEEEAINVYHSSGHFSTNLTKQHILQKYWCPKLYRKIKDIVDNCACKQQKSYGHNPQSSAFPFTRIKNFETVSLDIVSMPKVRNYDHILTMIDLKSRLLAAVPLASIDANTIATMFYKKWICVYGPPSVVHTDQGLQFTSSIFISLCKKFGISGSFSSIYHPKGNSVIERCHRTLKDRLRSMSGLWIDNLDTAVFNCNRCSGCFLSIYNRTCHPLCDWPNSSDFLYRKEHHSGPQPNDHVSIRDRFPKHTLSPRFHGVHRVVKRHGNSVILADGRQVNIHDCNLVGRKEEES